MTEPQAATEIVAPLVRRRRARKAAIVIVTYPGQEPPPHLVRAVGDEFSKANLEMKWLGLSELAPNPVARLADLRDRSGIDVFSIDCGPEQLKYGTLISSLNIHRNTFARQELCAAFWMPADGMEDFARQASNFLDFRTRLVEVDAEGQVQRSQSILVPADKPVTKIWRSRYAASIAYAHRYAEWVAALRSNLERCLAHAGAPAPVFLDDADLGGGRSWVGQLQAGLDQADHLILVVTPETMASPRLTDEWEQFVAVRRDWTQGWFQMALLVDTPLPPFLELVQAVDFRDHDGAEYRRSLAHLVAGLLEVEPRRSVSLPAELSIPAPPQLSLPPALRRKLVDWLASLLPRKLYRNAVATSLGLESYALDGQPSSQLAASAALVLATGDDDQIVAARRVADILTDLLKEEPEHLTQLDEIRRELREVRGEAPESGLLGIWLDEVGRDQTALLPFFQQEDFASSDLAYLQLELRSEIHPLSLSRETELLERRQSLQEFLGLDPARYPWITRRWVVLGDPGSGKTTLLRHLARSLAHQSDRKWVPIFESLPQLMRDGEWLLDRVERRLYRSGHPARGLAAALDREGREGRLLLLLDGLDAVPREARIDAETLLRDLSARWPDSPLVVATRRIGYRRPGIEFLELELLPFDGDNQRVFLARWLGRHSGMLDEAQAGRIMASLEADPVIRGLTGNPLYLTLIARLVEDGCAPARSRIQLYDQILDLLLEGRYWTESGGIDSPDAVRRMLRYLAYAMTRDNRDAEPVSELEARLYQPEADGLRAPLERVPRWRRSMRRFLDDVAELTGILGPHDGPHADWRFWHRTFREALAAEWLEELYRVAPEAVLAEARTIAGDESRWAEPYALLAGRVEDPDELVQTLVRENRALGRRALATAQGISDATLNEILELSDDWRERAEVYARLPELIAEPEQTLALVDRLRRRTRNGNDLYFLDLSIADAARRWPAYAKHAAGLRARLYDHIPEPPEGLFCWIETPLDGRIALWREIPAGSFLMGSPEYDGYGSEHLQHRVTLASPFLMLAVPVTNAHYAAFDPGHEALGGERVAPDELAHHPVVNVSWYAATAFCRWHGSWAPGARLPSEAEWEYACRAGTQSRFWSGDDEDDLDRTGWFDRNSGWQTHRVGEKPPNPWGLYDVHGNVWEWTSSPWSPGHSHRVDGLTIDSSTSSPADQAPMGVGRVIRGGSYGESAIQSRAAYRKEQGPGFEGRDTGFRVVLAILPA
ncbi:MAG TPA: SUMF1/EgtB/PvdO family nonheme iron enzyme [Thermoanaerobaculia bacterium]|jgi:formylglycine-generating enzyme required for sulfatase activity/energy-coupling factor transporter ATP-binding protein EcfA2